MLNAGDNCTKNKENTQNFMTAFCLCRSTNLFTNHLEWINKNGKPTQSKRKSAGQFIKNKWSNKLHLLPNVSSRVVLTPPIAVIQQTTDALLKWPSSMFQGIAEDFYVAPTGRVPSSESLSQSVSGQKKGWGTLVTSHKVDENKVVLLLWLLLLMFRCIFYTNCRAALNRSSFVQHCIVWFQARVHISQRFPSTGIC